MKQIVGRKRGIHDHTIPLLNTIRLAIVYALRSEVTGCSVIKAVIGRLRGGQSSFRQRQNITWEVERSHPELGPLRCRLRWVTFWTRYTVTPIAIGRTLSAIG